MSNNLVTQIRIQAGVSGINQIQELANQIEQAGGNVSQLRQNANALQSAWQNLSTDEQTRRLQNLSQEAERLRNITNARMTLGLTGDEQIRQQIRNITAAFNALRNDSSISQAEMARATAAYRQQLTQLNSQLQSTTQAQHQTAQSANQLNTAFGGLKNLIAGLGLAASTKQLIEMADEFNNLQAKVKLATGEGIDFANAMTEIKNIADETQLPLTATGELFTKLTGVTKELGLSQNQVLGITKTINQAMSISGGSAESMNAAIIQLAQGLSAGALRGDEFNSVVEQAPRLAKALADGLGVNIGKLREMAGEGKLTAETVTQALTQQADVIASEYAKMPSTVSSSLVMVKNAFLSLIGQLDDELNSSSALTGFIQNIAKEINNIDPAIINAVKDGFIHLEEVAAMLYQQMKLGVQNTQSLLDALGGVGEADEKVSFLVRTFQGLGIAVGVVADGVQGIQIAFNAVFGWLSNEIGRMIDAFSIITGKGADVAKSLMERGSAMMQQAEQSAMQFKSRAIAAMDEAAKTSGERLNDAANAAKAAYNQMAQDGTTSLDKLQGAFADYAQKAIKANNGVVSETLKEELAIQGLQAQIDETGKVAIIAAEKIASISQVDLSKFKASFEALGLDAKEFVGGLADKTNKALAAFNDLAAVAGNNTEKLAMVYQAAKEKIGDNKQGLDALNHALKQTAGGSEELTQKVIQLAQEQKHAKNATSEQQKALDALGVNIDAVNQKMSTSGLKTAENLKLGLAAIKEQVKGADNLKTAIGQALDTSLKSAQTKADFDAIKKAINEAGLSASVTGEQMAKINAGTQGGAEAVKKLSDSTAKHSEVVATNSRTIEQNSQSLRRNQQAIKEQANETQKAQEEAAKGAKKSLEAYGAAHQGLSNLGLEASKIQEIFKNYEVKWAASLSDWISKLNRQAAEFDEFRKFRADVIAYTDSLKDTVMTTEKLTQAKAMLKKAEDANLRGIKAMDAATLNNLRNQIKQTEERFYSLADSAKKTVEDLQSELAGLQGDEETVRKIRQNNKIKELESKLQEAQSQHNHEAAASYQKALELQNKINREENKQAADKNATPNFGGFEVQKSANHFNMSAKDVGDLWEKHLTQIKEDAKSEAKQEFIKEMHDDIKRRAR